jgi:hypothetical protein
VKAGFFVLSLKLRSTTSDQESSGTGYQLSNQIPSNSKVCAVLWRSFPFAWLTPVSELQHTRTAR